MQGITKSFFGVQVLKNVDFELEHGEVHVLLGENGAGKSTLMRVLSGACRPDCGRIYVNDAPCRFGHPREAQRAGISIMYQQFHQAPQLTVAENIFLGDPPVARFGGVSWARMRLEARRALDLVGAALDVDAKIGNLGVAECQMVEIAAALRRQARILIMDEPTASLTETEAGRLFELVDQIRHRGAGIIYISHRLDEIFLIGTRVTVLRDGAVVRTMPVGEANAHTLVSLMAGRAIVPTDLPPLPVRSDEVLRLERLGRIGHFRHISLAVRRGEIVGLAGLVGAGRTALAEAIAGLHPADSGAIFVGGKRVRIRCPSDASKLAIGFATEDRLRTGLTPTLSLRENMTLAALARGDDRLGRPWRLNRRLEYDTVRSFMRELGIRAKEADDPVRSLSGGNQQKVVIAKWFMARCRLLILDEPTLGIDVGAKEEIHRLIVKFAREDGGAVLLISSDIPEVLKLSDRILVMAEGRLEGELSRSEATAERIMKYAVASRPSADAVADVSLH